MNGTSGVKAEGSSILYWAIALHQSRKEISYLLSQGCNAEEHSNDAYAYNNNFTPIHLAAQCGYLDILHMGRLIWPYASCEIPTCAKNTRLTAATFCNPTYETLITLIQ